MHIVLYAPPISRPHLVTRLSQLEGTTLTNVTSEAAGIAALGQADVFVMPQQYTTTALKDAIASAPQLQFIQLLTAGLDKFVGVRLPAGARVSSGSGGLAPTVAEHAVALALSLGRLVPKSLASQANAFWDAGTKEKMVSLFGKTVAVVGFGGIGQEIAKRLAVFGARVIGVSSRGTPNPLAAQVYTADRLDDAVAEADFIILALPASSATYHLFDGDRLARCRPGAFLINVGRGSVVHGEALRSALESGQIGGAAVDVTDPEPLPAGDRLWGAPNLIITPHCAAGGGYPYLADYVANNIGRIMRGEDPQCELKLAPAA